jgi:hypothetical protein
LTLNNHVAGLGETLDELGLITDVQLEEHGLRHGAVQILAQNPADLSALKLWVFLDDHATHAEVHSHNLAWVVGNTGVVY